MGDELVHEAIAEEMFDLTNNPHRQAEREEQYGRGRSVLVGDIVNVGNAARLCQNVGWVQSLSMPLAI